MQYEIKLFHSLTWLPEGGGGFAGAARGFGRGADAGAVGGGALWVTGAEKY